MAYKLKPRSLGQEELVRALGASILTFVDGPAGCGKTHIAISHGVELLGDRSRNIDKIILCRPAVSASAEIGYLPGSLSEKLDPYMRPFFDELSYHYSRERINEMIQKGEIEVAHLGMLRGRNFHRSYIICDEAQNATFVELRLLLTRIGRHSKMVVCGDSQQSDLDTSRFVNVAKVLNSHPSIDFVKLTEEDIQRSEIVAFIERTIRSSQAQILR